MDYGWVQVGVDQTASKAPLEEINPYEDWEKVTRPDGAPDPIDPEQRWQPVYVMLQSRPLSYQKSAEALLRAVGAKVAIGEDSQDLLQQVAGHPLTDPDLPERLLRFFIFRPEGEAYSPLADGQLLPHAVIAVGPAIPGAFVDESAIPPLPGRDVTSGQRGIGREVVTAVIDDITGIANARFREGSNSSRFHHFWAQGLPRMATVGLVSPHKSAEPSRLLTSAIPLPPLVTSIAPKSS